MTAGRKQGEFTHRLNMAGKYHIEYEKDLNSAQCQAVMSTDGPLLVIAGAGSGKTRTLTYRVARLVEEGVPPKDILLLTFTRKASAEMLGRASFLLDRRCEKVSGGTFHSFANSILRRYAEAVGFDRRYTILDRADTESLIGMVKKELGIGKKQQPFPRNQTLANIFSKAVNQDNAIEDIIYDGYPHFSDSLDLLLKVNEGYQARKVQHSFLDYDDLLVFLHLLLKEHTDIRQKLSTDYRYIMVDEYQDTNHLQAEILYLLADRHQNVMAVGDDSQSIYAFRGASFRNIMDFPRVFPETTIIGLEENYRSVQPILTLTNTIISQAEERYEKKLFTRRSGGSTPLMVDCGTDILQSQFVAGQIDMLHRQGVPLQEIAVLFRAGFHSFKLEIELNRGYIPFIKVGGFKFTDLAHIKDMLAHLRVLVNLNDRISWYRLLLLLEKIGPKTAQKLYEVITAESSVHEGLRAAGKSNGKHESLKRLQELYAGIDADSAGVADCGEAVLNYYRPILEEKHDDHPKRLRDLEQLLSIMQPYHSLDSFLVDMALEPPNTSADDNLVSGLPTQDRLVLSTIHSAKGLEWDTVFIIWARDGWFPSVHALDDPDELEEERRLMYVAATRARNNLIITYPSQVHERGVGLVYGRPSRFIDDMPDDILEKRNISF